MIAISDDDIERFDALRRAKHSFDSIILRFKLSEDEIARFSTQRWRFPGVDVVPYLTRAYPLGEEFAHVVGYVGRIDVNDAQTLDAARYDGTTHIGKTGIERKYEDDLHGEPGFEEVEVNVNKKEIRKIRSVAPTPGKNIYLTVDARLQKADRRRVRRPRRRGRRDRSAQRRSAGDGQRAEFRSEPVRQRHRPRRLRDAAQRAGAAAAQSRHRRATTRRVRR